MSLVKCLRTIPLDADDAAELRSFAKAFGSEKAAVTKYLANLNGELAAARAELKGQGFDVALPTKIADVVPDIFASTSSTRAPYKGEQTRPDQGIPTPPGKQAAGANSDVSLTKITRNFTKIMELTLRQGRISLSKTNSFGKKLEVMGQYDRKQAVTRVRTMSDLSTVVHEAGHDMFFDPAAPAGQKQFVMDHEAGLMQVATDLYGGDTKVMPRQEHIAEGYAEFFRVYVLNRRFAQRKYPAMTIAFDEMLDRHDKKLRDNLAITGAQYAAWLQLPSAQMIRNMVVSGKRAGKLNEAMAELKEVGFQTWYHEYARSAIEEGFNRFAALDDLVNRTLDIGQKFRGKAVDLKRADDARALIRLAANAGARAHVQLSDGIMGHRSTDPMTRSLRDALVISQGKRPNQNVGKIDPVRQGDFAAYIVSLRAIDEHRRFDLGLIDRHPIAAKLGDLTQTVAELNAKYPEFAEAAQIAHEYSMGLWKKMYDAGLMTEESYVDGLDRKFYVPLQRDMSDKKSAYGTGNMTTGGRVIKRFTGSDRDIIDPMDILINKTHALEQIIARNEVMVALDSLAERAGAAGAMIERVPASQMVGKSYSVAQVARQLAKDPDMSEADAADFMLMMEASIKDDKTLALFRAEQATTGGENMVFFWKNGKLAALQFADGDLGADVVNTVNALGVEVMPLFLPMIAKTSSAFRNFITLWPDHTVMNLIRDQFSTAILTNTGFIPFVSGIKGTVNEIRQRQMAKQYNAAMGTMGGAAVSALHEAKVTQDIAALRKQGYIATVFRDKTALGWVKGFARLSEVTESGSRLGLFEKAYKRAKKDGLTDWEASIEASYMATDVANFGLNGSRMTAARRLVPFLNAQLQGLYKMGRVLGGDEVRQRKGTVFALTAYFKNINNLDLSRVEKDALKTGRAAWVKMSSLALISAALHFLFEDDPDYQNASEYLRATGWVVPLGNGRIFYIPKPFELAILANLTERMLEHGGGDGMAKKRMLRGLALNVVPPMSPPLVQAYVEYKANKDFFSDNEIVPSYMQALDPVLQFNSHTSGLAMQISEITGWSPMVLDHFMSSLGASAYRDVTNAYNAMDRDRPESEATDWPIVRRIVRDARGGSTVTKDFWGEASTKNGMLQRAEDSYQFYLKSGRGDTVEADAYLNTLDPDDRAYALLNGHQKAEAKRLHPFRRVRDLNSIVSGMRRELVTEIGVDDTTVKASGDTIKLTRREKNEIDNELSELMRREMRNTLIAMKEPGWHNKTPMRVEETLDLIYEIDPRIGEELERRMAKEKIYDGQTVLDYWPEVKDRLLSDRENTFLDDIVAVAKVAG